MVDRLQGIRWGSTSNNLAVAERGGGLSIRIFKQGEGTLDKLAKLKQVKGVGSLNEDLQKILLDIPSITIEEQIDRYARCMKPFVWREMCTK